MDDGKRGEKPGLEQVKEFSLSFAGSRGALSLHALRASSEGWGFLL